jgi:hypothetical protein
MTGRGERVIAGIEVPAFLGCFVGRLIVIVSRLGVTFGGPSVGTD